MHVLQHCMYIFRYTYSQSGEPTIIPKNSNNIKLGQLASLSKIDKLKINKLYDCGQEHISHDIAWKTVPLNTQYSDISSFVFLQTTWTDQAEVMWDGDRLQSSITKRCHDMKTVLIKIYWSFQAAFHPSTCPVFKNHHKSELSTLVRNTIIFHSIYTEQHFG